MRMCAAKGLMNRLQKARVVRHMPDAWSPYHTVYCSIPRVRFAEIEREGADVR